MTTTTTRETPTRATARTPEQVAVLLAAAATAGDVDGAVSLFEPDALLLSPAGAEARGAQQLQTACTDLCATAARFDVRTEQVHVSSGLALVSSTWTRTSAAVGTLTGQGTQVLRAQPDGRWLAVVDDLGWSAS